MSKATLSAFLDRIQLRITDLANLLPLAESLVNTIGVHYALPNQWLSEKCFPRLFKNEKRNPKVWETSWDSWFALGDEGAPTWSPMGQPDHVDHRYADSGFLFDLPMDADEGGIYNAESCSEFALAPHETFWEAPYTSFLLYLAGETNLSYFSFISNHDIFPLSPIDSYGVNVTALLPESPIL